MVTAIPEGLVNGTSDEAVQQVTLVLVVANLSIPILGPLDWKSTRQSLMLMSPGLTFTWMFLQTMNVQ